MAKYYVGQDNIQIRLETEQDCSSATNLIKYQKPNGTRGSWAATCDLTDADNSIIYYDVNAGDIDVGGTWRFWSYVTFAGGEIGIGEVVEQEFMLEGNIQ